ncbi:double zinc ribbon and ankyrin repeat-containing protein 1 [Silurus asotus]|uniref:Double zinc ribbon and ankyrin repeat-containing protein 1 n=1 Tax=Silurus asotus TaxID=30991 RepID=A0AAD5B8M4_SILAS|nr:double zinc ribbon and ankyrin repeat-containing protein 1 [Silurus asotus]
MAAGSIVAPFIIPIRIPTPGKAKHEIDNNTPVEIKSDTPGVSIFYTLDGTKPELLRRPGFGDNSTMRYTEPIRLPCGKVHVRAVAVTSDGRQSAVVTKVFVVTECVLPSDLRGPSDGNQEGTMKSLEPNDAEHVRDVFSYSSSAIKELLLREISFYITVDVPVLSGQRAPPLPSPEQRMVPCSKCNRLNHTDARFCDWCGAKPGHTTKYLTCSKCGASSHPYANFCGSCGVFMEGPPRGSTHSAPQSAPEGAQEPKQHTQAANMARSVDAQTQTTGLFYPSSTELQKRVQQKGAELSKQGQMSDRKPLLTAISPGRGYWRKQLDHICSHLRSYTQNNSEFRALVGEPRMGRMISAVIEEDGYEVSLRVNFVLAPPDRSRGANPSCLDSDERPPLVIAVLNGHHDVIPTLVQKGADVDQLSGPLNNSALHEAAGLGTEGLRSAEILLGCNSSLRRLNNHGQTPHNVAEATGCSSMVSLLAAHRSRSSSGMDAFS